MKKESITKEELKALVHWATVGFTNSRGGSYDDIPEICQRWARKLGLYGSKKSFRVGNKQILWITPKAANELWCAAVNRQAKVPSVVKYDLYRIRKLYKTNK